LTLEHTGRLRRKSVLHLILGGAAVHRCGDCTILNKALAAGVRLSLRDELFRKLREPLRPKETWALRSRSAQSPIVLSAIIQRHSAMLDEGARLQFVDGLSKLFLRVHHDRAVPGDRLLDRLARREQKALEYHLMSDYELIVLQKSFCTDDQKF
jgi:hypothetical protein